MMRFKFRIKFVFIMARIWDRIIVRISAELEKMGKFTMRFRVLFKVRIRYDSVRVWVRLMFGIGFQIEFILD